MSSIKSKTGASISKLLSLLSLSPTWLNMVCIALTIFSVLLITIYLGDRKSKGITAPLKTTYTSARHLMSKLSNEGIENNLKMASDRVEPKEVDDLKEILCTFDSVGIQEYMTQEECDKAIACFTGEKWEVLHSKNECKEKYNSWYENPERMIKCSFSDIDISKDMKKKDCEKAVACYTYDKWVVYKSKNECEEALEKWEKDPKRIVECKFPNIGCLALEKKVCEKAVECPIADTYVFMETEDECIDAQLSLSEQLLIEYQEELELLKEKSKKVPIGASIKGSNAYIVGKLRQPIVPYGGNLPLKGSPVYK